MGASKYNNNVLQFYTHTYTHTHTVIYVHVVEQQNGIETGNVFCTFGVYCCAILYKVPLTAVSISRVIKGLICIQLFKTRIVR